MRTRRRKGKKLGCLVIICLIFVTFAFVLQGFIALFDRHFSDSEYFETDSALDSRDKIVVFAREHSLQETEWTDELIELMEKNPETEEFVLYYPLRKDKKYIINLEQCKNSQRVPLLFQWDKRWGYCKYGNNIIGISGCGPTCLSMVSIYLLNNTDYNPKYIAEFSEENGYYVSGQGSAWALISEGGRKLGLNIEEIPLDENIIKMNLNNNNPIICIMGPGDFTDEGHFIVLTEYNNGMIKINDPNSKIRSEKLWKFDDIKNQICNMWACSK